MTKANRLDEFEKSVEGSQPAQYLLRLYLTGITPRSIDALRNIKRICEENLEGKYILEVVDIYQRPQLASDEQIIAAPTLIKVLPSPVRRLIGDLSNKEKVLLGLDLKPQRKRIASAQPLRKVSRK